jgi:hypothetical protein
VGGGAGRLPLHRLHRPRRLHLGPIHPASTPPHRKARPVHEGRPQLVSILGLALLAPLQAQLPSLLASPPSALTPSLPSLLDSTHPRDDTANGTAEPDAEPPSAPAVAHDTARQHPVQLGLLKAVLGLGPGVEQEQEAGLRPQERPAPRLGHQVRGRALGLPHRACLGTRGTLHGCSTVAPPRK